MQSVVENNQSRVDELAKMRQEYSEIGLDESQIPANGKPFALVKSWLDDAIAKKVTEPNAMCLSTVSAKGRPSSRYVLLKEFDEEEGGVVWYTNYESRKGNELQANPFASVVFWWGDMERSIRIEGQVEKVSATESDTYFAKRPRGSELGAWASNQSRKIESSEKLHQQYDDATEKFKDQEQVPRPEFWGGYKLKPDSIEFWKGRRSRLHDRLEFKLQANGEWTCQRLQP